MKGGEPNDLAFVNADRPGLGQNEYAQYNLFSPGYLNSSPWVTISSFETLLGVASGNFPIHRSVIRRTDGDVFESKSYLVS